MEKKIPKVDLTGKVYGRLTVLELADDYIDSKGIHQNKWKCECNCENHTIVYVTTTNLVHGGTISCGCYSRENASKRLKESQHKKYFNTYDLSGEYAIGYTMKGEEFWFDKEDYDKIKDYYWHYTPRGYLITNYMDNGDRITLIFHRFIMEPIQNNYVVDHIIHPHGNALKIDNRKQNLEIKTTSQNTMNAYLYINNTSGVSGVTYTKNNGLWQVRIGINGKRIHLGYYDSFDEAVRVRKEAEELYWGRYSFDNCQKEMEEKYA